MLRSLVVAVALAAAAPALAATDMPTKGAFGVGASFSGDPLIVRGGTNQLSGLNGSYFILDELKLRARFGLGSEENYATAFALTGGASYYFSKKDSLGIYLGGDIGFQSVSPSGGSSQTGVLLDVGPGVEYFVNRHFSVEIQEGLTFSGNPNTISLTSLVGINIYL